MWKRAAAVALERASRVEAVRAAARRLSLAGHVPVRAQQHMHVQPEFDVPVGGPHGSFRYRASDQDAVGRHLFWSGLQRWEVECWREFVPLARSARGFLDVGAFTGCYSLVAATVNPRLRAVAFEPVEQVHERLVANITLNRLEERVSAVHAAVSDTVGTGRFYLPDRALPDTGHLESSLRRSTEAGAWFEVRTTTVAAALPEGFHVDLVKVDVEDAEGPVIGSMRDVLAEHRPHLFVEMLATGSYEQAVEHLRELDYRFFHLTADGRRPVDRPDPRPGAAFANYLCEPAERSPAR